MDTDGLSGTIGGAVPYHTNPLTWFSANFGRSPGSEDQIRGSKREVLLAGGFSVIPSPNETDPFHVSIGGVTPGIVLRNNRPSWPGNKIERKEIETRLAALFAISVWP